jgi:AcrR family transcriptional regulator
MSRILFDVPRLWTETIETHRREVREAILDAAWALVHEHGPLSVTMAQIAEHAGIGRATLYKYFPDVEAILLAWHQRHVEAHVRQLDELAGRDGDPGQRLESVLRAYALICYHRARHGAQLGAALATLLHRGAPTDHARRQVHDLIEDLVARTDGVRQDVSPAELASYCQHALAAAADLPSEAAVRRLVGVTLSGVRRPPDPPA